MIPKMTLLGNLNLRISMSRLSRIRFIVPALLAVVSCNVNEDAEIVRNEASSRVFKAVIEAPEDPESKVYADENLKVLWNEDDRVSIFDRNAYNREYKFDGKTGDSGGSFSAVDTKDYPYANELDAVYAVYPYNPNTRYYSALRLILPSFQTYAENSFGQGANTMLAVSEDDLLIFKNVCGYLMVRLYGEGLSVSSLKLEGRNGELIGGEYDVSMAPGGIPSLTAPNLGFGHITLDCETPVALGPDAEHYTAFWFVVPPVTFENGIKLTVTLSDGRVFRKTTSQQIEIVRNTRARMTALEVVPSTVEAVDLGLWSKWSPVNVGAAAPEDYGNFYAWGELSPKVYYGDENYSFFVDIPKYTYLDGLTELEAEDDVAHVLWGGDWHIASYDEWEELLTVCIWEWKELNGTGGFKVTGPNGNSIFLPAADRCRWNYHRNYGFGFYWTSTLGPEDEYENLFNAVCLRFSPDSYNYLTTEERFEGLPVRPVSGSTKPYLTIPDEDSELAFQQSASQAVVHVSSNQGWSARLLDAEDNWLEIAEGAKGSGNGTITLSVKENSGEKRFGTLVILNRFGAERARVKISQDGIVLDLETNSVLAPDNQIDISVKVESNAMWTVEKKDPADTWFSISTPDGGNGNGTILISFEKNTGATLRKGAILVKSVPEQAGGTSLEKEIVLKQAYPRQPVRVVMNDEEMNKWESDWNNLPVYTSGSGTLFQAKSRLNRENMPLTSYTFRWKNIEGGVRIRHWFCFDSGIELKMDLRPSVDRISFSFNAAYDGTSGKPSLSAYYDVDFTKPIEVSYQFQQINGGYYHVSYLVNGVEAGSYDTSADILHTVRNDAPIHIYFGCDQESEGDPGSAVLEWYEYIPAVDWGD